MSKILSFFLTSKEKQMDFLRVVWFLSWGQWFWPIPLYGSSCTYMVFDLRVYGYQLNSMVNFGLLGGSERGSSKMSRYWLQTSSTAFSLLLPFYCSFCITNTSANSTSCLAFIALLTCITEHNCTSAISSFTCSTFLHYFACTDRFSFTSFLSTTSYVYVARHLHLHLHSHLNGKKGV